MKIIATYSGGKGGTGKTTILGYLSLLVATLRGSLIIDMSSEGGISNLMLGTPSPPYLRDFLLKKYSLYEVIGVYEVEVSDEIRISFNMISNMGSLDNLNSNFIDILVKDPLIMKKMDYIFIDIPTFQQNKHYMDILSKTKVLIVMEPTSQSINAALSNFFKDKIYILNSPHPYPSKIINEAVKILNKKGIRDVTIFPYDAAVSIASKYFPKTLAHLSKQFTSSLRKLAIQILR